MTEQRFNELQGRGYCHSDFLSLDEQNMYFTMESRPGFRKGLLFGVIFPAVMIVCVTRLQKRNSEL